ncbi:hypothetical protein IMZ48_21915 [Candidatus Bathyarchaeota archaeon]|nr:hypothetical protein [Candidatus Bathyarchaeota archaeon]
MVYWIQRCLHNHSDTLALNMLRVLAGALRHDSRVFIVEQLREDPPSVVRNVVMDMVLMGFGGKLRTREEWECMTAKAGLKINSVVGGLGMAKTNPVVSGLGPLALIECVRDQPVGEPESTVTASSIQEDRGE